MAENKWRVKCKLKCKNTSEDIALIQYQLYFFKPLQNDNFLCILYETGDKLQFEIKATN